MYISLFSDPGGIVNVVAFEPTMTEGKLFSTNKEKIGMIFTHLALFRAGIKLFYRDCSYSDVNIT